MAVITRINGIPLFSSIEEALRWGKFNRLKTGYHIHYWEGRKGYMGGNNHSEIAKRRPIKIDPILAAKHIANNPLSLNKPVQLAPVQPIQPIQPMQPMQPAQSIQSVQPITIQTTPRSTGGGGGGGY